MQINSARYLYSVGREGLAPRALGKTHPRWKSPHIASITQSVVAAIIVGLFAIFTGTDNPNSQAYLQLYGLMAVMGVIIILLLQEVPPRKVRASRPPDQRRPVGSSDPRLGF